MSLLIVLGGWVVVFICIDVYCLVVLFSLMVGYFMVFDVMIVLVDGVVVLKFCCVVVVGVSVLFVFVNLVVFWNGIVMVFSIMGCYMKMILVIVFFEVSFK